MIITDSVYDFFCYYCIRDSNCVASMTLNGVCLLYDTNYKLKRERGFVAWIAPGTPLNSIRYPGLGLTGQKVKEQLGVNSIEDCWNECLVMPDCVATMYLNRVCSMFDKNFGRSREPNAIASVAFGLTLEPVTYQSIRLYNQYERDENIKDPDACWQQCLPRPECVASFIFGPFGCHFYNKSLGYLRQDGYSSQVASNFKLPPKTYQSLRLFNQYARNENIKSADACWQECLLRSECVASFIFETFGCHFYNRTLGYLRQPGYSSQLAPNIELAPKTYPNTRLYDHYERIEGIKDVNVCWQQCLLRPECVASFIFENNGCHFFNQSLRYTREEGYSCQVVPNFKLQPKTYQSIRLYNQYARNEAIKDADACWQECLSRPECVASFIFETFGCHFYNKSLGFMRQQGHSSQIATNFKIAPKKMPNLQLESAYPIYQSNAKTVDDCWSFCLDQNECVAIMLKNEVCYGFRGGFSTARIEYIDSYVLRAEDIEMRPYVINNVRLVGEYKKIDGVANEKDCWRLCIFVGGCLGSAFSGASCYFYNGDFKYVKDPERSANMMSPWSTQFSYLGKIQTNFRLWYHFKESPVDNYLPGLPSFHCWTKCYFEPNCIASMLWTYTFAGEYCLLYDKTATKSWYSGKQVITSTGFDVSSLPG